MKRPLLIAILCVFLAGAVLAGGVGLRTWEPEPLMQAPTAGTAATFDMSVPPPADISA